MKNASPIGIPNDAQASSERVEVVEPHRARPGRAQLGVAAAQRHAALAGAEDAPLDQVQQMAVVGIERLGAEIAQLGRGDPAGAAVARRALLGRAGAPAA